MGGSFEFKLLHRFAFLRKCADLTSWWHNSGALSGIVLKVPSWFLHKFLTGVSSGIPQGGLYETLPGVYSELILKFHLGFF